MKIAPRLVRKLRKSIKRRLFGELQPGDLEHRAFVGPPKRYERMGHLQLQTLIQLGLRPQHRLLDIGCGSLRAGKRFIPYLDAERYFGIEPNEWLNIVNEVHRPIGNAVAKAWNMSPEICKAIKDCVEFDPIERASAANAVRFANALAKREGVYAGHVDMEQVDTILLIGRSMLGLDDDGIAALSTALRAVATSEASS